ncbi:hypothetical protein ACFPH6_10730 [Streptomyces xiangluensis]|uniref:WD40 repeat n=1 Tax=Streptomyces xiangluensis TaxID=2665720 RepID=A0ABV8YI85_9ACTN
MGELEHVRLIVEVRSGHAVLPPLAESLPSGAKPAVMDLDEAQWTDPVRYAAWHAGRASSPGLPTTSDDPFAPPPDLADPVAVCAADPVRVTAAYEAGVSESRIGTSGIGIGTSSPSEYGGLRTAWLRAGQSLLRDQTSAERALVLLTALGDGADPRLRPQVAELAAGASWQPAWNRVCGDVSPPWPGPVFAAVVGSGPLEGQALLADHQGVLRTVTLADATPTGRLGQRVPRARALSTLPDGSTWVLDAQGHLHTQQLPAARPVSGLAALLDDGPTVAEQAAETLTEHLARTPGTALAATGNLAAVGDATGTVHTITLNSPGDAPRTARLHEGRVTALCVVDVPVREAGQAIPLIYSGGSDGCIRAWAPDHEPLTTPVAERPYPVVALSASYSSVGVVLAVGWADGLVEYHGPDADDIRTFHPGLPVNALVVTPGGELLIGTDESLICLRPR